MIRAPPVLPTVTSPGAPPTSSTSSAGSGEPRTASSLQALGGYWSALADVNLVSDAAVVKDTVDRRRPAGQPVLRSSAVLSRRTDDSLSSPSRPPRSRTPAWGGFSVLESDRWPYPLHRPDPHQDNIPLDGSNRYPYSSLVQAPIAASGSAGRRPCRSCPTVRLALPRRPLGEHFELELRRRFHPARAVQRALRRRGHRRALPAAQSSSGGPDRATRVADPARHRPVSCPSTSSPVRATTLTQGDRVWQPGEREARMRLDLVPRLPASFALGDWLRIRPSDLDPPGRLPGRGHPRPRPARLCASGDPRLLGGLRGPSPTACATPSSPACEYRAIPGQWGRVPGNTPSGPNQPVENRFYDEIDGGGAEDAAAPGRGAAHPDAEPADRRGDAGAAPARRWPRSSTSPSRTGSADTVVSLRGGYAPFSGGITFRYDTQRQLPRRCGRPSPACQIATLRLNARLDQIYLPGAVLRSRRRSCAGHRRAQPPRVGDQRARTSPASAGQGTSARASTSWWGAPSRRISRWASDRPRSPSTRG